MTITKIPRILCIGDIMIDTFVYGQVERISPEAPVPVLRKTYERKMAGGAANVAANLQDLNCEVTLVGAIGDDPKGKELLNILSKTTCTNHVYIQPDRKTTSKVRFLSGKQHMLRVDDETLLDINKTTEQKIISLIESLKVDDFDAVIVSDYCKGTLTEAIKHLLICKFKNITKIVDTKNPDLEKFSGADILVPNLYELESFVKRKLYVDEQVKDACIEIMSKFQIENVLATRGQDGITLVQLVTYKKKHRFIDIKMNATNTNPVDVSGAGDTVAATLAYCLATGIDMQKSTEIANIAAGITVGKTGTSRITLKEIQNDIARLTGGQDG